MFWNKPKQSKSIDDELYLAVKRWKLIDRAKFALKDTTDYDLRLRNFMTKNHHNQFLIIDIVGHMSYMKTCGADLQLAAKETLEKFKR